MGEIAARVAGTDSGAVLTFAGSVRADGPDRRRVLRISYEGYEPMALSILRRIVEQAERTHGGRAYADHRLGTLEAGEISIGIAVASPHRADGFAALREIIEQIKKDLPIWKKEEFSDGTSEWVNCAAGREKAG